jgi:hypothetical protein
VSWVFAVPTVDTETGVRLNRLAGKRALEKIVHDAHGDGTGRLDGFDVQSKRLV